MELGMPTLIECKTTEECAALCRALGLQFVELNMNLPQYQPGRIRAEELQAIAEKYRIYYTIHLDENLNVSDFNPYVAEAWRRTVRETIRLAGEISAPVLNMHLPRGVYFTLPDQKMYLFAQYKAQYLRSMKDFRDMCSEEAQGQGVRICVENSSGYADFQIEALDLLLQSPVFGLTFDIGHSHATGGQDASVILARKTRLCHFHLHDAAGRRDHLPFGEGEIKLSKYFALAGAYAPRAVLETKTIEGLQRSVAWLRGQPFCPIGLRS